MEKEKKIKVGISIGDLNGIGSEIILKTFADKRMLDFCTPVLFASSKVVSFYKKTLKLNIQTQGVTEMSKVIDGRFNVCNIWKDEITISYGKPSKDAGKYAFLSLEKATEALKNKEIDVLVTAPINKDNIQSEEFNFPGHTEYLESKLEGESLMILMTDELRVGLITGHIPISKVAETITPELIQKKVDIMYQSLVKDFGINKPKIAILGLNPHCGDHGVIGNEDDEIVRPTIEKYLDEGKQIYGPYAADSFFGSGTYKEFDAVLAMYHDQGLAPFKTIAFGNGVNYTAGLSEIRTSPDHGTAYNISGKGMGDESSFKEALFQALTIHKKREEYKALTKNVLKVKKTS
ncbi:4-hydroxythreonine-4-phosphate dehydrogenase PdxA [Aureivirga sp. CE67]|uniref:4-hydroxythreonine-4-phosphate dehydrogenase PdxA n=1 Tax=Aureivirga sp. CE67 TaxID=1788983 RepID=UPI0018CB752F|nr:4-hydroxythreonine-4-phosphate dehydrogenase PdxA [Aureivirga sp. CE67]